jgi:hypothetical protein
MRFDALHFGLTLRYGLCVFSLKFNRALRAAQGRSCLGPLPSHGLRQVADYVSRAEGSG